MCPTLTSSPSHRRTAAYPPPGGCDGSGGVLWRRFATEIIHRNHRGCDESFSSAAFCPAAQALLTPIRARWTLLRQVKQRDKKKERKKKIQQHYVLSLWRNCDPITAGEALTSLLSVEGEWVGEGGGGWGGRRSPLPSPPGTHDRLLRQQSI